MTLIWLSSGLPVDRDALAVDLGPSVQVATQAFPPPGTSLAVATVFERELISRLASVPGAGATLLFRPPGTAAPQDLPRSDGPVELSEASDVADVAAAVRRMLDGGTPGWPSAAALVGAGAGWAIPAAAAAAPAPAPGTADGTGNGPGDASGFGAVSQQTVPRSSKRRWLASGGVVAAAALAAVVVLATQGGASNSAATGFRGGPGGLGGYGLPGAPGAANGSAGTGTGTTNNAQRQAFLACLQENGVDTSAMTSGQRPRLDPSDPATATAFQACQNLMPQRGAGGDGFGGHDRDGDGSGVPGTPPVGTAPGSTAPGGTAPGVTAPGTST